MEQEVNMKITCIAVQSGERVGQVFLHGVKSFVDKQRSVAASRSKQGPVKKEHSQTGGKKVKIKDLRKDGSDIQFVDIKTEEMKDFQRYARKYGITYAMEMDKSTQPPTYYIYFKAKDGLLTEKALSEYIADRLKQKEVSKDKGVKPKLEKAKEKVTKQIKKVKKKEIIR